GTFREEYRLVFPDGSIRWVRDRAFPIRNKAGEVYRLAGIVEDITALKGAELALAARVRQQKALADLGRAAMEKKGLQEVVEETVETVARLLNVDFCKILEHRGESGDFLMRAGVGWPKEMVGRARIFAGEISQAGFAMKAEFP